MEHIPGILTPEEERLALKLRRSHDESKENTLIHKRRGRVSKFTANQRSYGVRARRECRCLLLSSRLYWIRGILPDYSTWVMCGSSWCYSYTLQLLYTSVHCCNLTPLLLYLLPPLNFLLKCSRSWSSLLASIFLIISFLFLSALSASVSLYLPVMLDMPSPTVFFRSS